ncbi:addiction module protein [Thiorhodococcus mannitoliphagus]|uniref:Addiction module protein n=1 Tax=Thiorhodococcus mannitoliphagus TaxID=329406 RepID=A0A6P1DYQ3_9GAMM|nr:addiction module protein [Thiorhodococcus mannitoliphagus]NEX23457.1 addiction module protein [Thiorhodococcus mannitoliphagus]
MPPNLRELPVSERTHLVEDQWDSIAKEQSGLPLTDAQRRELDQRLNAYESDGDSGREAREAIADIRART